MSPHRSPPSGPFGGFGPGHADGADRGRGTKASSPASEGAIRTVLNYDEKRREFERFLSSKEGEVMVLATSHQHRVFARSVLVAHRGVELFVITWRHSRKCMHIAGNAHVALCKDRVQIEGTAEIVGGVSEPATRPYLDLMRSRFPDSVERLLRLPNMVVIRIRPAMVAVAAGSAKGPAVEFLDLETRTAWEEKWAHY